MERITVTLVLGLVAWGVLQLIWNYPSSFYPRFHDEAIYAFDSRDPQLMFGEFRPGAYRYAPAKLGYGIPLAGSVALFGPDGPMYLSTLFWFLTLTILWVVAVDRFGLLSSVITVAMASFSPMFGKYIADVGPTPEAALGFVLLWVVCAKHRAWLTGLSIGFLAFVDFKWAMPAGLALIVLELVVEKHRPLKDRAIHVLIAGLVALGVIGLAMLLHRPYAEFLYDYVFRHSAVSGLLPSPIFLYYLLLFGALPAVVVATIILCVPKWRNFAMGGAAISRRSFWHAVVIALVPILFHSVFGVNKALRFFAVLFPVLTIPVGVMIGGFVRSAAEWLVQRSGFVIWAGRIAVPIAVVAILHGGSDGPAHHLALPTGYQTALKQLRETGARDGTVSSYNWPVVLYGWPQPVSSIQFAYWGLKKSDRWIALNPMMDRVTVELRAEVDSKTWDVDSVWSSQRDAYVAVSDSLFSVPSDYYSSDYYLSEVVPAGASVLKRWRETRHKYPAFLTLRQLREQKAVP